MLVSIGLTIKRNRNYVPLMYILKIVVQEIALHQKDERGEERKGHDRVVNGFVTGTQARIEASSEVGKGDGK